MTLPPPELRALVGDADPRLFRRVGRDCAEQLLEAGLPANGRILDLGCGCGRVAAALLPSLGPGCRYVGLDAHGPAVEWCRRAFDERFTFVHGDVRSAALAECDFAFAISLFTHLPLAELRSFLRRVRAPKVAFTVYLRRESARFEKLFPYSGPGFRLHPGSPTYAFPEEEVVEALEGARFTLVRGNWAARRAGWPPQDLFVLDR